MSCVLSLGCERMQNHVPKIDFALEKAKELFFYNPFTPFVNTIIMILKNEGELII